MAAPPAADEWIGCIAEMPAYVTGEGEPFKPVAILWMDGEGMVLGTTLARPGEWRRKAGESLRAAIEKPMFGRPHAPAKVQVASEELAEALREAHPGIEFSVAPTPEIDELVKVMAERMSEGERRVPSFITPEIPPETMAGMFRAAAALHRAKPWKVVPSDQHVFVVSLEAFRLREGVISVIGQGGQNFGFILFASHGDYKKYLRASEVMERGRKPSLPPFFILNFERGADLEPELRKEITRNGWEVAAPDAYPWPIVAEANMAQRPLTVEDAVKTEAIALALVRLMDKKKELRKIWAAGESAVFKFPVETSQGAFEVVLGVPNFKE